MNGLASSSAAASPSRAKLRLLDGHTAAPKRSLLHFERPIATDAVVPPEPGHILVAGADALARTHMLCELREVLPSDTSFVETDETWEALTLAERSQMVVLVGDLGDLSGASMVRLLARRQPALPVLAIAEEASETPPGAASG